VLIRAVLIRAVLSGAVLIRAVPEPSGVRKPSLDPSLVRQPARGRLWRSLAGLLPRPALVTSRGRSAGLRRARSSTQAGAGSS